ncbi:MAG: AraC family transcriptional regulator [Tannerellaceae bacterium]|nr:AraC family transcriptional regulator [Tannerellaceae bacterium]
MLELFHLLTYSYSKRELAGLFYPVLKREDSFARFIEENYPRLKTAKELVQEAHMSLKSFENKFNYVFGISPGRWMIRRKTEIVYQEITSSSLPLSVIADKCGFATLSHMTDFCKKHLGTTPTQIRKRSEL